MNVCVFFFSHFVRSLRSEYERQKQLTATKETKTWTMKTKTTIRLFPLSRLRALVYMCVCIFLTFAFTLLNVVVDWLIILVSFEFYELP